MDRNTTLPVLFCKMYWSLSARRAWIEIIGLTYDGLIASAVALRKESVDRNTNFSPASLFDLPSLSARRAWIEIMQPTPLTRFSPGRSPQGERG